MVQTETVSMGYRTPLAESVKQHALATLTNVLKAILGFAQKHQPKTPETAPCKERHSDYKNSYKYGEVKRQNLLLI
jgi:hypothetical protein